MHSAIELAEFYISYNGGVLSWYTLLIGRVLHGRLTITPTTWRLYYIAVFPLLHPPHLKWH